MVFQTQCHPSCPLCWMNPSQSIERTSIGSTIARSNRLQVCFESTHGSVWYFGRLLVPFPDNICSVLHVQQHINFWRCKEDVTPKWCGIHSHWGPASLQGVTPSNWGSQLIRCRVQGNRQPRAPAHGLRYVSHWHMPGLRCKEWGTYSKSNMLVTRAWRECFKLEMNTKMHSPEVRQMNKQVYDTISFLQLPNPLSPVSLNWVCKSFDSPWDG